MRKSTAGLRLFFAAALPLHSGAVLGDAGATPPTGAPPSGRSAGELDTTVSPCTDFYAYTCDRWRAANPIPPDQSLWGRFGELHERNRAELRAILTRYSPAAATRSPLEQKIGDHYATCMDDAAIEKAGLTPLAPALAGISRVRRRADLAREVAALHRLGANVLFQFGSGQDFRDATQVIAQADQGGLGLPDRDYYLKDDPGSLEIRHAYVEHVRTVFELLGRPKAAATQAAQVVLRLETALATASLDRVSRRNPEAVYHRMGTDRLRSLAPSFDWRRYFAAVGAPPFDSLNVAVPSFFEGLNALLDRTSVTDWHTYLTWHLVHAVQAVLPATFVQADFEFYGKVLTGAQELQPRWKRCVSLVDSDLGFALGQKYVQQSFSGADKERTLDMVKALEAALAEDIVGLAWMAEATRKEALAKLRAITNNVGYPSRWRDYSTVQIVRGDALGNHRRAAEFESHRQLAKIGKPVDRTDWEMTPPTVNAYYDPQLNSINLPAGILRPPFFHGAGDRVASLGAIGAVIGHELTHGFDDEGRRFDARGDLRDWWTREDAAAFDQRSTCFVDEYSAFVPIDDVHLNGRLTLGENIADNGGLRLAHMALVHDLVEQHSVDREGVTPEARFFIAFGQVWCQNVSPAAARLHAVVDPHSPGRFRVNGTVRNMTSFAGAFSCHGNDPVLAVPACRIW